jgi:uncharacterized protein (TIGR03437 family)
MPRTLTLVSLLALGLGMSSPAQTFNGFTTGNIVVSRSVYSGSAATLAAGQPLPPVCPSTAACGTAKATDSGAYASTSATNNVFNNNIIDGSFGVTSPLFLDQLTPTGTLVSTLPIPTTMVSTSFSSKSEVALNLSTDGTAITFMAYVAPSNTIDVSNSNTPGAYDPTNPAGGSFYRSVVQVGANGAIQVTPTNAYSGNNGRAAILANGTYYMAGNGNNGGGTPANIVATEGVQLAIPGQSFATPPIEIGALSISQVINPATGLPYPPDKLGKDNNFRGLTIFNNTLYVTKGSGSNGFNTVYRVGDQGSLPTPANAASAAITILPGFPTTLAKASTATFPFGIFFANATTLYVADEGDGTVANAATSKTAGLQKWVLKNGTWTLAYVLQNGLNLGQPYGVANYPSTLNPATDGLRNITGSVAPSGLVTIWGITSTVSPNGDQGADPNQLVSITDVLINQDPVFAASNFKFTILRTANAGEVLRGVSLAPTAGATPAVNVPLILNAANPSAVAIAPGSVASANGQNLTSASSPSSTSNPPTITISITDSTGTVTPAPDIMSVSPNQIYFLVPSTVAIGTAQITVTNGAASQTANNVEIATVSPGILTANGSGLARANVVQGFAGGVQTVTTVYTTDGNGAIIANPVSVESAPASTYLVVLGTGIANAGTALTTATINGVNSTVTYAGPSGSPGFDQVNILIPAKLAGAGNVEVQLTVEGVPANPFQITLK